MSKLIIPEIDDNVTSIHSHIMTLAFKRRFQTSDQNKVRTDVSLPSDGKVKWHTVRKKQDVFDGKLPIAKNIKVQKKKINLTRNAR